MTYCEFCGEQIGYLPFTCKYCGGTFCKKHRLPENHECTFELKHVPVVPNNQKETRRRYKDVALEKPAYRDLDQGPRSLKKYLKRQDKQRKRTIRTYNTQEKSFLRKTKFLGTKTLLVMIILFSIIGVFFIVNEIPQYMYLSLNGLIFNFTFHTFFTSIFISEINYLGFFFLIIMLFFLYFMAKNIELRKGTKFLIKLYIISGLFSALFYILLRLSLVGIMPFEDPNDWVGVAWGGILGLLSYSLFPVMNQEITALMYFLPIRLKGRSFLILIILIRLMPLLFVIYNPISILFFLPDLGGILGAYILFKSDIGR